MANIYAALPHHEIKIVCALNNHLTECPTADIHPVHISWSQLNLYPRVRELEVNNHALQSRLKELQVRAGASPGIGLG